MRIIRYISIVLVVFLSFSSCNKDNDNEIYDLYYMKLLPQKITSSEGQTVVYSYDTFDKLIGIEYSPTQEAAEFTADRYRFQYNEANIDSLFIYNLKYTENKTVIDTLSIDTLAFVYEDAGVRISNKNTIRIINFDSDGRILSQRYENEENTDTYTFEYTGQNNSNITSAIKNQGLSTEQITTYTYDDKKGAFKNVRNPQWFLFYVLNTYPSFTNNNLSEGNVSYTYTYSENNYPRTRTGSNGSEETIDYIRSSNYTSTTF